MAAYTKGTQSPALDIQKRNKPLSIGTSMQQYQAGNDAGGQVGQSFGRMIGGDTGVRRMTVGGGVGIGGIGGIGGMGGMGGMGDLEAASMRLANAATAREMRMLRAEEERSGREFARERGAQVSDQEAADKQSEIASLEQEFSQLSQMDAATPAERIKKNERLSQIRSAISGAKSELANIRRRGIFESLNMASRTRFM